MSLCPQGRPSPVLKQDHGDTTMTQQNMTAQQTVTALFDDRADARRAIDELVSAGISRTSITLMPEDDSASSPVTGSSYDTDRDEKGFFASLADFFLPDED